MDAQLRRVFVTVAGGERYSLGGGDGEVNKVEVLRGGQSYVPIHLSKEQDILLKPGDMVWVRTPGGGGYGEPVRRLPEAVLEDVNLGRLSIEQASKQYFVIIGIDTEKRLFVDKAATKALRNQVQKNC